MPQRNQLISIIMPVKNEALYLEACLSSIAEQSHVDFECIVADDHSTDRTAGIIQTFEKKDPRFKYVLNTGDGIIPALQTAYGLSSGGLITRMDGDDIMPSDKLENLHQALISNPQVEIATGLVKYFPESEINEGYRKYEKWLNALTLENKHFEAIYRECVIASPNWLISRENFEKAGGFDNTYYPEDYDLVFRFYENDFKITSVKTVTHLWRDHPERTSRNHKHYKDQHFFDLKLHYFLKLDYDKSKTLVVWGAGLKGKLAAKILQRNEVKFRWCCNNEQKYHKHIRGVLMEPFDIIEETDSNFQIIVAVSQRNAGEEISEYFGQLAFKRNADYFFFC